MHAPIEKHTACGDSGPPLPVFYGLLNHLSWHGFNPRAALETASRYKLSAMLEQQPRF